MCDNLPKYPPIHDMDIAVLKTADPEVLSAFHAILFSGHAATHCADDPVCVCYSPAMAKLSALIRGIEHERSAQA